MGQVTVQINGRGYPISCEDGQEDHLSRLASYLNVRVEDLAKRVGQIGDAHLMVIASLMVADELSDAYDQIESLQQQDQSGGANDGTEAANAAAAAAADQEARIASVLSAIADRVEHIASRLESA